LLNITNTQHLQHIRHTLVLIRNPTELKLIWIKKLVYKSKTSIKICSAKFMQITYDCGMSNYHILRNTSRGVYQNNRELDYCTNAKRLTGHVYQNVLEYFFISQIYHSFFNKVGAYPIFLCMCKIFSTAGLQVGCSGAPVSTLPYRLNPTCVNKTGHHTQHGQRYNSTRHTWHPTLHIGRYYCDISQDDTT